MTDYDDEDCECDECMEIEDEDYIVDENDFFTEQELRFLDALYENREGPTYSVNALWKIDLSLDPIRAAATFYALQAIGSGALREPLESYRKDHSEDRIKVAIDFLGVSESSAKSRMAKARNLNGTLGTQILGIEEEARNKLNDLVKEILPSYVAYLDMVIGGELRHHFTIRRRYDECGEERGMRRNTAWDLWYDMRREFSTRALEAAVVMFQSRGSFPSGDYGGENWADMARTLLAYEQKQLGPTPEANDRMMMDRIFSLQHNNGSLFYGKVEWYNKREHLQEPYEGNSLDDLDIRFLLRKVLDAHGQNPVDIGFLNALSMEQGIYSDYTQLIGNGG